MGREGFRSAAPGGHSWAAKGRDPEIVWEGIPGGPHSCGREERGIVCSPNSSTWMAGRDWDRDIAELGWERREEKSSWKENLQGAAPHSQGGEGSSPAALRSCSKVGLDDIPGLFHPKGFCDSSLPPPTFFPVPLSPFFGRNSCLETPNLPQSGCSPFFAGHNSQTDFSLFFLSQFPDQLFPPFSLPKIPKPASPSFSCPQFPFFLHIFPLNFFPLIFLPFPHLPIFFRSLLLLLSFPFPSPPIFSLFSFLPSHFSLPFHTSQI